MNASIYFVPAMISGIAVAQDIIKEKKQQSLLQ